MKIIIIKIIEYINRDPLSRTGRSKDLNCIFKFAPEPQKWKNRTAPQQDRDNFKTCAPGPKKLKKSPTNSQRAVRGPGGAWIPDHNDMEFSVELLRPKVKLE